MKKFIFKGGLHNPLCSKKAHFDYEVIEPGVVSSDEWDEDGRTCSFPKRNLLIGLLGGGGWSAEQIYCTVSGKDAEVELRRGEIISLDLRFGVKKRNDGTFEQVVSADNLFTLNDYHLIREAEALYKGSQEARNRDTD